MIIFNESASDVAFPTFDGAQVLIPGGGFTEVDKLLGEQLLARYGFLMKVEEFPSKPEAIEATFEPNEIVDKKSAKKTKK